MKSLFRTSILLICFFALCSACTKEDASIDNSVVSALESDLTTRSDISPDSKVFSEVVKHKKITKEFIPVIIDGLVDNKEFADTKEYSIETVSKDGRNLMYVVNFEKGGWVIISGRYDIEGLILSYDVKGEFNPEKIDSPECRYWFEMTQESIEQRMIEDKENNPDILDFNNDYFWVLVPITPQYTTELIDSVASFVPTKWGQGYPWNYKCPSINGSKCITGCVAVAYAQLFYYLHYDIGKPTALYHQIDTNYTWNSSSSYYSPHHTMRNRTSSSYRWNYMPLTNPNNQTAGTEYVGDLMTELGQEVNMQYKDTVSLASLYVENLLPHYSITASYLPFFITSTAVSQLDNRIPVLVRGNDYQGNGHAWILDGYEKYQITEDRLEQWQKIPIEYINDYNGYVCYNETDMRMLFPDVVENQLVHNYSYSYYYLFSMNWGWDGNNDGVYSMHYGIPYLYNQQMVVNFH